MLKFDVTYSLPQQHFIDFTFFIDNNSEPFLKIDLPSWRPGRYEIGNFAQNIQQVRAFTNLLEPLRLEKITKDCWLVHTKGEKKIVFKYRYYAATLNAGSSYLDEEQLYINPVNCFMYIKDRVQEQIQIQFIIPSNYHIATQLSQRTKHTLIAHNFDELADSPLIASASLKHLEYGVESTTFHLWFQGDVVLDEKKISDDFIKFSTQQIKLFGDCESKDYHFLIQVSPTYLYHGVEHLNSSVNAIGPGDKLMETSLYTDFIGLCSHEMFHLWNIKRIRPQVMLPYHFKHENYSSMGYVYEGITTYYGDLILFQCGVYSFEQYATEVNIQLQKHFNNYGRYNQSLADSSMDTWLDGYIPGIPDRKVNIYTEGMLSALILDASCIAQTEAEYSLDDIMKLLYNDTYKKGTGYDELTWKSCIESVTGHRYDWYFNDIIHGCGFFEKYLDDAIKSIGLKIVVEETTILESRYGIRSVWKEGKMVVIQIAADSNASVKGLAKDDQILELNNIPIDSMNPLLETEYLTPLLKVKLLRNANVFDYIINAGGPYFMNRKIMLDEEATPQAKINFAKWSKKNHV